MNRKLLPIIITAAVVVTIGVVAFVLLNGTPSAPESETVEQHNQTAIQEGGTRGEAMMQADREEGVEVAETDLSNIPDVNQLKEVLAAHVQYTTPEKLIFTYVEMKGDGIYGKAGFRGGYTGFHFVASLQDNAWEIEYAGQDAIPCSLLLAYHFSKTSIPSCWHEKLQKIQTYEEAVHYIFKSYDGDGFRVVAESVDDTRNVNFVLVKGGEEKVLFEKIYIIDDFFLGPTTNPNVVLMKVGFGDAGYYSENRYYVDAAKEEAVSVFYNNRQHAVVAKSGGTIYDISLLVEDKCSGTLKGRVEGKNPVLIDFMVNDTNAGMIEHPIPLECTDPYQNELGPYYAPNIQFDFVGVRNDLSKAYFTLTAQEQYSDSAAWEIPFVFDMNTERMTREIPDSESLLDE